MGQLGIEDKISDKEKASVKTVLRSSVYSEVLVRGTFSRIGVRGTWSKRDIEPGTVAKENNIMSLYNCYRRISTM